MAQCTKEAVWHYRNRNWKETDHFSRWLLKQLFPSHCGKSWVRFSHPQKRYYLIWILLWVKTRQIFHINKYLTCSFKITQNLLFLRYNKSWTALKNERCLVFCLPGGQETFGTNIIQFNSTTWTLNSWKATHILFSYMKYMMCHNDSNCSQLWQNTAFSQISLTSIAVFQSREETIFGRFGENQETKNLKSLMQCFSWKYSPSFHFQFYRLCNRWGCVRITEVRGKYKQSVHFLCLWNVEQLNRWLREW